MLCSFQSSQLGSIAKITNLSLAILRENTRHFTSFCRLLDDNRNINYLDIKPIVKYDNADLDKESIIKDNKGKTGVYRWINLITGKTYVGSSVNLGRRFKDYYNYSSLINPKNKMLIYRALLKHGYSNFKLEILEYCNPEKTIEREQYYLDHLKPEYNTLHIAGSTFGFKHTEETLAKFKGRKHSKQVIVKIREHLAKHNSSKEQRTKARKRMIKINERKGVSVEVFDLETKVTKIYDSILKASKAIGCVHRSILLAEKAFLDKGINRPIKKKYLVKVMRK